PAEAEAEAEAEEEAEPVARKGEPTPEAVEPPRPGETAEDEKAPEAAPQAKAKPQRVQPKAAQLRGPKVVRIEEPDVLPAPRRRGPGGPGGPGGRGPGGPGGRGPGGPGGPPPTGMPDLLRSQGPARGRGVKSAEGAPKEDEASRSPRRRRGKGGRGGEAAAWFKGARRAQDLIEREERLNTAVGFLKQRRRQMKKRAEGGSQAATPATVGGKVQIAEPMTIKDLSAETGIKATDIVKFLFNKGVMATINNHIDAEAAMEICLEYDIELEVKAAQTAEESIEASLETRERKDVHGRPPVVAVLGHVDHGKTSLLDRIRVADVATGEAGGITQNIGAFRTTIQGSDGTDKSVVFLDTPGHQAFTSMRSRGATLADIVVLVIAADDGVMPQTIESIDHAKAAGVAIVVALNKIDKPEATDSNIQKIYGQLAERELSPVEWGGQTEVIKVSAETGEGVKELVEILDYQAELQELTADYAGEAYGFVVEAQLDPGRGPIARVLVQEGRMRVGDTVVAGRGFGKVRSLMDDKGKLIEEAGPATPVEVSGLDQVPDAGDKLYVTSGLRQAEEIAEYRRDNERKHELASKNKITLANVFEQMKASEVKELRVVLKADVQGTIEVLRGSLEQMGNEDVKVRVLHAAVGGITESDVLLAEASDAVIIGFQVIASPTARSAAERRGVDVRLYRVIYDITDDVNAALEGMLDPTQREEVLGHAEVRDVFRVSKVGAVAGCYVTDGIVRRNALIRVTRNDIVIEHDRTLEQLKRFKDDAREVRGGMECGMKIQGYDDIQAGDILECYVTREEKATL
ncbi:MAG: translation initiation factor IF-2, partial [Phycisphaeraceae bacterium]